MQSLPMVEKSRFLSKILWKTLPNFVPQDVDDGADADVGNRQTWDADDVVDRPHSSGQSTLPLTGSFHVKKIIDS